MIVVIASSPTITRMQLPDLDEANWDDRRDEPPAPG
jgi:hypothetical protein